MAAEISAGVAALSGFFTENAGQVGNAEILFYRRGGGVSVGLAAGAVVVNLHERPPTDNVDSRSGPMSVFAPLPISPAAPIRGHLVRITFEGANPVLPQGRGELSHRANFFLGDEPAGWRTNVRNYAEVVYEDVWDGIDVVYRTSPGGVKYDLIVHPWADIADVAFAYEGVTDLAVNRHGLTAGTSLGPLRDDLPAAWQASGLPVECGLRQIAQRTVGYACWGWDGTGDLVIDPLLWATFLGGSGEDRAFGLALDGFGNHVVAGYTGSLDFPVSPGGYDVILNAREAFVAKLSADGASLLWATFLGGSSSDETYALALDSSGRPVVTGRTGSSDFPATPGAYDTADNGNIDAFVAKLSADGASLLWATFLGGTSGDHARALALDRFDNPVVVGYSASTDFPATPGAYDVGSNGLYDAFVAKLSADGASLLWSTYLGSSGDDQAYGLALDSSANPVVTGITWSPNFPATPGRYDTTFNGGEDAFVTKLSADGASLLWATFLGGADDDRGYTLALDGAGITVVAGITWSPNFPATPGSFDATLSGTVDGYVARLTADGTSLLWATFLGGGSGTWEGVYALALDGAGNPVMAGYTESADFPATPGAYDVSYNGGGDAFLGRLTADGSSLLWATFLGGSSWDAAIALSRFRNPVLAGITDSTDFPATPGAYDASLNGGIDGWIARIEISSANGSPIANAGTDFSMVRNQSAMLDGSGSGDPDGDPLLYLWTQVSGPPTPIANPMTAVASLTPLALGSYEFRLNVSDGVNFSTDNVVITVLNAPPVAIVNPDYATVRNTTALLVGNLSYDPSGDPLVYQWTQVSGPESITLSPDNAPWAWFVPTRVGMFVFQLTVWDNYSAASNDSINVTVGNRAPLAGAGPAQPGRFRNALVTLNGTGSSDPDGDPLTFVWTEAAGPPVALTGATTASPSFTPTTVGTYTFQLTVDDGMGANDTDEVNVDVVNRGPIADAGPDQSVPKGTLVALNGNVSADPDSDALTFNWTQLSGPPAALAGDDTATPNFTAAQAGTYLFQLEVTDPFNASAMDTVTVVAVNAPPIATLAATPPVVAQGLPVAVTANGSWDPDGSIVAYNFTFGDGSWSGDVTSPYLFHTWNNLGNHDVNLTVRDDDGTTATASLTLCVCFIVENFPPVAVIAVTPGPDGNLSTMFTFNGSASWDPNGEGITAYLWDFGDGSNASTVVAAHGYAARGTYDVSLTVWNVGGGNGTASVQVNVTNRPPGADAGPDKTGAYRNTLVSLNGTGSSDPDGDSLAFAWTQTAGPTVALVGADTATPSFTPSAAGRYTFKLAADDGFGGSGIDTLNVTVVNRAPIADVGGPYACAAGGSATLDGTGSTDPDGDALSYSWTVHLTPPATLSGPTPTMSCPTTAGTFNVTLRVTDPDGSSGTDDSPLVIQPGSFVADWLWPLLVLAVVLALLLILFVMLRRKKQDPEEAPPTSSPESVSPEAPPPVRSAGRPPPEE